MDKKKKKGKVDGTGPKGFRPSKVKPGRKKKKKKKRRKEKEKKREEKKGVFCLLFLFTFLAFYVFRLLLLKDRVKKKKIE